MFGSPTKTINNAWATVLILARVLSYLLNKERRLVKTSKSLIFCSFWYCPLYKVLIVVFHSNKLYQRMHYIMFLLLKWFFRSSWMMSVSSRLTVYLTVSTDVYFYEIEFLQKYVMPRLVEICALIPKKNTMKNMEILQTFNTSNDNIWLE